MSALKVILSVVSVLIIVCALIAFSFAKKVGSEIGAAEGIAAGRLSGSFEGLTTGLVEGAEEGKEAGLSAKDTEVIIGNKIQTVGKLEVLSASVVMHDMMEISNKYKTLLAFYGDITFTVDLFDAEIVSNGNLYEVTLPMPEATLRLDDKKSEQLASNMKHFWSGSNEDGYTAAINSIRELTLNAEQSVANYDFLMDSAISSAEKQVSFLIQSATREEVTVRVRFKNDNE